MLDKKVGVNQPKRVENAKILIANTPMDTDKIKVLLKKYFNLHFLMLVVNRKLTKLHRNYISNSFWNKKKDYYYVFLSQVFGSRVRVDAISKVAQLELAEKEKMKSKVEKILKHGCNVFINRWITDHFKGNYNHSKHYVLDLGLV